jgi:hypothetical protein
MVNNSSALRSLCVLPVGWYLFAFLVAWIVYIHQKGFNSATPVSRLDLLHAVCTSRQICIDRYQQNTSDKAKRLGHYYSDKAPGTAAAALVPFIAAAAVLRIVGVSLESRAGWLFSSWLACSFSIGLVAAAGAVVLFAWISGCVARRHALVTSLAVFLGAAPLPYSTMMFSHALVVGLLCLSIWAVARSGAEVETTGQACAWGELGSGNGRRGFGWLLASRLELLAGFSCGLALTSEYTSGLVVIGIFLWLVSENRGRALLFCLAAVPPLLLIPAYSWACLGTPFALPYSYQASFPEMRQGLYAIKWPDAQTAFNLLFSPARGLFFWSPFLLMAGFGYGEVYRRSPRLFWLTYAVPVLDIIVISGRVWDWPAGPTLGPRLLAPILPLLALPCAFGVQKFPKLGITLAAYSILITTLATLTNACIPFNGHPNPLFDFTIPLFLKGQFSPNLGMVLGLPPYASVALFYVILVGGVWWIWRRLPPTKEKAQSVVQVTQS